MHLDLVESLIAPFYLFLQTINFDSPRGGISLVTEKGVLTTSRLLVQKAIPSDSGKLSRLRNISMLIFLLRPLAIFLKSHNNNHIKEGKKV